MKPKEIQQFFDTSVRKLKKIYRTEAVEVAELPVQEIGPSRVAICMPVFGYGYDHVSILSINAELVASQIKGLDEPTILATIATMACHEMAHHLADHKAVLDAHQDFGTVEEVAMVLKTYFAMEDCHGKRWQKIMAEMGASPNPTFHQVDRIPTIFNGRL